MKRILILATDKAVNTVLKRFLSDLRMDVKALDDPAGLHDLISAFKPDVLLIDFFLEDVNGGSICHQLKCNPATHQMPVILLTEYPELISFSRKFGCNAALPKPVDARQLATKIAELTGDNGNAAFVPVKQARVNHKNRAYQH